MSFPGGGYPMAPAAPGYPMMMMMMPAGPGGQMVPMMMVPAPQFMMHGAAGAAPAAGPAHAPPPFAGPVYTPTGVPYNPQTNMPLFMPHPGLMARPPATGASTPQPPT